MVNATSQTAKKGNVIWSGGTGFYYDVIRVDKKNKRMLVSGYDQVKFWYTDQEAEGHHWQLCKNISP